VRLSGGASRDRQRHDREEQFMDFFLAITIMAVIVYAVHYSIKRMTSGQHSNAAADHTESAWARGRYEAAHWIATLVPSIFAILLLIADGVLVCIHASRFVASRCANALVRRPSRNPQSIAAPDGGKRD
jgi:hypothetical protein